MEISRSEIKHDETCIELPNDVSRAQPPSGCQRQDEDGTPKKPKKGLLGLGDRLAARAAAIAKTAENALQAVSLTCFPAHTSLIPNDPKPLNG